MLLQLRPYSASYAVKITIENLVTGEEPQLTSHETDVKFLKIENDFHVVEVINSSKEQHNYEVQDAFSDILYKTSKAVERIVLKVDPTGKAVEIINTSEIFNNWNQIRLSVEGLYKGKPIVEYLDLMEESLKSEMLFNRFKEGLLNALFFNGMFKIYEESSFITLNLGKGFNDFLGEHPVFICLVEDSEPDNHRLVIENFEVKSPSKYVSGHLDNAEAILTKAVINGSWLIDAGLKIKEAQLEMSYFINDQCIKRKKIEVEEIVTEIL